MIATLTPHPDFAPVPRVAISVAESAEFDGGTSGDVGAEELDGGDAAGTGESVDGGNASAVTFDAPEGADVVTLWRTVAGRTMKVRGAVQRAFSGSIGHLDMEAPPNATSTYEIEFSVGDVSLGRVTLGSTFLPWTGPRGGVILQQPLDPKLNAVVRNMAGSWPEIDRTAPGGVAHTEGAELGVFTGFGPQGGAASVQFDFEVRTRADAAAVWATRGTEENPQLPIWLIRTPNPGLLPHVFFAHVATLREVDVMVGSAAGRPESISRFRAVAEEVRAPIPGLVTPSLRYSDLAAVFPTYSALAASLSTYHSWATAWEYAGAAG